MSYSEQQRHMNTYHDEGDGDSDDGDDSSSCDSVEMEEDEYGGVRRMSAFSIETGDEIYDLSPTPLTHRAYETRKRRSARRCRCAAFFVLTFAVFLGYLLFAVVGGGGKRIVPGFGRMRGSGGGGGIGGGVADDVAVVTDGSGGGEMGVDVDGAGGGDIAEFPDDVTSPTSEGEDEEGDGDNLPFRVLDFIPHDPSSFTQGLTYHGGILYESTGLYKQSKVRRLDPSTGDVLDSVGMDPKLFGEGMTCVGTGRSNTGGCDSLVQITWKSKRGFVYDPTTLEMTHEFEYQTHTTEGWGITYIPDTHELVVSDGSEYLHFWSGTYPFEETRERIRVVRPGDGGEGVQKLNELEYVGGHILANIWFTDSIIAIDPMTGEVRAEYDFGTLWPKRARNRGSDVFNGISVSDREGELFVTGKKWGKIFRVSITGFLPAPLDADWMDARKEDGEDGGERDEDDDGKPFRVLGTLPHDPTSFTQGLTYFNGILYESTGLYGESKVRRLDPTSGDVVASVDIGPELFGEGMTCVGTGPNTGGCDLLVQVTWKSERGFVYDPMTLEMTQEFRYRTRTTQGWGITYIPETHELVVSDGSEYLHFWSGTYPFEETREPVPVFLRRGDDSTSPVRSLNELEYVGGSVLANIWQRDTIVRIDPSTGEVEESYDLGGLWPHEERSRGADVLNGISLSDREGELFITGKKWPQIYRVFFEGLVRYRD